MRSSHGRVVENFLIADQTYRIRLDCPEIARTILPGQFVMVRPATSDSTDPLLGRPLAVYDVILDRNQDATSIDLVYHVIGRGTSALSQRFAGETLQIWGPLGNGFPEPPANLDSVVLVAGGIGQTPMLALGKWWKGAQSYGGRSIEPCLKKPIELFYGVRTAALAAGIDDFEEAGIVVSLATDDGSAGHRGFVTDLLRNRLSQRNRPALIIGCGPPVMLETVSRLAQDAAIPCLVSLENHMACGFGACYSCVVPVKRSDGKSDLLRACVEGPIFWADRVEQYH